jgi:transcriptional antiterminator NusG
MWYVIQVMTGEEDSSCRLCQYHMNGQDYRELFIPKYARKKRYRGAWNVEQKVLFPGYVFVDTEAIEKVAKQLSAVPCMTKLLRHGDDIVPITREEQTYLANLMDEQHIVQISTGLVIGDEIWITEGALRNYRGQIKRIDRHRRTAELEVNLFGRKTPVQVGLEVIQKVTKEEFEQMRLASIEETEAKKKAETIPVSVPKLTKRVRILSGVFTGMTGDVLEENKDKQEITASLNLFGKPSPVVFSREEVEYM